MGIPSHAVPAHAPYPVNFQSLAPPQPADPTHVADFAPAPNTSHPIIDPALLGSVNRVPTPSAPATSVQGHQRTLAQPMGRDWSRYHDEALGDAAAVKSLKIQCQEMDDKKKRTCTVLIWFEVNIEFHLY